MIEIVNLHKTFNGKAVLRGVSLTINKGETFALIGASGKGKSVLLKHLIGLLRPDSGRIIFEGQDINRIGREAFNRVKDRFGVVFQSGALFDSLTVFENVAFPLEEKTNLSASAIREKVMRELASVGMTDAVNKYPAQISGGMKKRAALARCLVMNPEIVLFDEPTTGLDPVMSNTIYKLIKHLKVSRGLTSFIISHEIPEIFDVADRIAMLHEGRLVFDGTPKEIQKSDNPVVGNFLRGEA